VSIAQPLASSMHRGPWSESEIDGREHAFERLTASRLESRRLEHVLRSVFGENVD